MITLLPRNIVMLKVSILTNASNLFSAVTNGRPVSSATAAAILTSKLKWKQSLTSQDIP